MNCVRLLYELCQVRDCGSLGGPDRCGAWSGGVHGADGGAPGATAQVCACVCLLLCGCAHSVYHSSGTTLHLLPPVPPARWFADARRYMAHVVNGGDGEESVEEGDGGHHHHRHHHHHHAGTHAGHHRSPHGSRSHSRRASRRSSPHHDGILGGGLALVEGEDVVGGGEGRRGDAAIVSPRAMVLACRAAMDQVRLLALKTLPVVPAARVARAVGST
jgi:hypothetical protein